MGVGVAGQMPQRGSRTSSAPGAQVSPSAPVTRQSVERGDPDPYPGIGIVGHGDEDAHGAGVDQVVEETATAFANRRTLVAQARADGAHRGLAAPQQFMVGRDGTLRVAQARDEGVFIPNGRG